MPYIDKQPWKSAQVLVLQACPLHEIIHEIDDYLLYYDAYYFPEIHKNCLETTEAVEISLLIELDNHKRYCKTCVGSNIHIQTQTPTHPPQKIWALEVSML